MEIGTVKPIICSGGLFLAKDTKRFLFLLRTQGKTAGTWGIVGGKKEPNDLTAFDILKREMNEEIGQGTKIEKVIPLELFVSRDNKFQYNTYILLTENEFIPKLNSEHAGFAWCNFKQWPKPLHQGVKTSFSNKSNLIRLEILLELL